MAHSVTMVMVRLRSLCIAALLLAGCGGSPDPTRGGSPTAPVGVAAESSMPGVEGVPGAKPIITVPKSAPPAAALVQPISVGPGSPVTGGQQIVGKYVGVTWTGREFASSWETPNVDLIQSANHFSAAALEQLVGVTAGSRVLLVLPPASGFGADGRSDLGVGPGDTLVYVVDVFGSY
jgi:hypothetical protein